MTKRYYIALLLFLFPLAATFAQPADAFKALSKYNNKELDSAVYFIDRAVVTEEGNADAQVWMFRGYIYKAIYKERDRADKDASSREISVESLIKSMELDSTGEFTEQNLVGLQFFSGTYHNDAYNSLNIDEYKKAQGLYSRFKEIAKILDDKTDFSENDLLYYSMLGSSVYSVLYDQGGPDKDMYRDKALECFNLVLQLDSNDFSANFNIGVYYYNLGVQTLTSIPDDVSIPEIDDYQEKAKGYFNIALPYVLKAYEINPYRREVYIQAAGIYYLKNNIKMKEEWDQKLKDLDKLLEENPNLDKQEADFNNTVEAVKRFVADNKRLPNPAAEDAAEKAMGNWIERLKTDYKNKHIQESAIKKLETIPGWTWE